MLNKRIRMLLFYAIILAFSLPITHAQDVDSSPFGELEVITPDNLDRLVKLRDLDPPVGVQAGVKFEVVAFNADNTFLAASGILMGGWLWSLETGQSRAFDPRICDCYPAFFAFDPTDPARIALFGRIANVNTLETVLEGRFRRGIAFDPTGRFILDEYQLSLLDPDTGALIRRLPQKFTYFGHSTPVRVCDTIFSPDGEKIAYTATALPTGEEMLVLSVLDLNTGAQQNWMSSYDAAWMGSCDIYPPGSFVFSADSRYLYANIPDGFTKYAPLTEGRTSNLLRHVQDQSLISLYLGSFAVTPDNQLLFYTFVKRNGVDWVTTAVDLRTNEAASVAVPAGIRNTRIAISRDGTLLAAYTDTISIWGVPAK